MNPGATLLWFTPLRRSAAAGFLGSFCPLLHSFHIWLFQIYFLLTQVISLWLEGLLWASGEGWKEAWLPAQAVPAAPPFSALGSHPCAVRTGI